MKTKKIALFTILTFLVFLSALVMSSCGASSYMESPQASYDYVTEESAPVPAEYGERADGGASPAGGVSGQSSLRHVIRTGSMSLSVQDTRAAMEKVDEIVADAEGLIAHSYVYEIRENQYGAQMTLRVPEKTFDTVMEQLEALGKSTNVQTGLEDVTRQYVDLESRLKNLKAQEARLVEILNMAETVEDVLEVEKELFRVRGDIESMQAQFDYLGDQIALSTIDLSLREESISTEGITPGVFDNFGRRIQEAFIGSINFVLQSFTVIIVALIALLPLAIFALVVYLIIRTIVRRRADKKKNLNAPEQDKKNM